MEKKISIIIPIFNSEQTLERCIKSIINQTYKNLEITLIDDGSIDNSGKICDEFSKKDKRIQVIHQKNAGVSCARNIGIKNSSGSYISFVDSDDYIENNMYEILIKCIEDNNSDVAICNISFETPSHGIINNYNHIDFSFERDNYPHNSYFISSISGYVCNKLYSRNIICYNDKTFVKFNPNIYIGEDDLFNYELFDKNVDIKYSYVNDKLYHYILSDNSTTKKIFNSKKLSYFDAKEMEINILEKYNYHNDFLKADYIINFVRAKIIMNKSHMKMTDKYYDILFKVKKYKKEIIIGRLPFKLKMKLFISLKLSILYKIKLFLKKNYN